MSVHPENMDAFLSSAGWAGALIEAIPGDASFRRYFRLRKAQGDKAMLMYAPPPHEDPRPFLTVAAWLTEHGMRAPQIYAEDTAQGWVLLEDFGNDRMRDWLDVHPESETAAYEAAIDALVELHKRPAGPFPDYDMQTYQRETDLLTQWYAPAQNLSVDTPGYRAAWNRALAPMIARQPKAVTVLRDYHAENIMLLGDPLANAPQGLIDFQDALVGHRAYDLVSLLQDARRDVSEELEAAMLARYTLLAGPDADFAGDYALLGAQRNAKIVGIFTRLYKRDGKPRYLSLIPRVWAAMERDLAHPALEPVAQWFSLNVPAVLRSSGGGVIK
jgi:hypothetical protein